MKCTLLATLTVLLLALSGVTVGAYVGVLTYKLGRFECLLEVQP